MFNLFDDDQTGKITLRNLKRVAKELGETMSGAWCACSVTVILKQRYTAQHVTPHFLVSAGFKMITVASFIDAELLEMIERADTDADGEISTDEFYAIMTKKTFT